MHPPVLRSCRALVALLCLLGFGCAQEPASAPGEMPAEITASELKARIDEGKPPIMLDVREPVEREGSKIEGSLHIPLGEMESRMGDLDKNAEIVVYCATGSRSEQAVAMLRDNGFTKARNLKGGMWLWQQESGP